MKVGNGGAERLETQPRLALRKRDKRDERMMVKTRPTTFRQEDYRCLVVVRFFDKNEICKIRGLVEDRDASASERRRDLTQVWRICEKSTADQTRSGRAN